VFDIAILDIMGVDGYGLLEIAKNRRLIPAMRTARALNPEHIIKSYKIGAALYVRQDRVANLTPYLKHGLGALHKEKSTWWRWTEGFESYCDKKFEADWKSKDKDFWRSFPCP
jgi:hypothetical protein